ncbi:YIP1 family protein [Candidatus Woesearchaeota archaeon]|nr:YIP1 family protein [Candidatus Woesearchaeota archaeon]
MMKISQLSLLFKTPLVFFKKQVKENFSSVFLFNLLLIAIGSLSAAPIYLREFSLSIGWLPVVFVGSIVVSLFVFFIITGLVHLSLRLFRGEGSYTNTVQAYVYGGLPSFLWAIPVNAVSYFLPQTTAISLVLLFVSLPAYVYSIYLRLVGTSLYHKMGMGKAFVAWLAPLVILFIIAVVIAAFFMIAAVSTTLV